MDRSKSKLPQAAPAPASPHRPRRRQFTIFGLMVLMFVVSIGFSQLYYWTRAEQRWNKLAQERSEQEKQAAKAAKDAANNPNTTSPPGPTKPADVSPVRPNPNANTADAAIAILMAVAMPMVVMIIASVAYSLRKWLRRRP